jgi:methionine synthase II (cobalamin-independent)
LHDHPLILIYPAPTGAWLTTPPVNDGGAEMALRTTVVGSWWKLDEHEDDLRRYHAGELGADEGQDLLDRAASAAIAEQQELGLDEWTGGEYFTDNFIDHMQRVLHGVAIDKPDEPDPFD